MTLTLLFDLDDTLLGNDINVFVPAYLKLLGKYLVDYVPPEKMIHSLLASTRVMIQKNTTDLSLEHSFDQAFYPAIGQTKDQMRAALEQFYEEEFPNLQPFTSQRPEAVRLVEKARQQGHTLVVATNPIFPRKAILHRLQWAGLPPEQTSFALITDFERFHFAKPNPAFFAEILAQLGWPSDPAVVIGNSLEDDLIPAAKLGLPVFWVTSAPQPLPEGFPPLSDSGPLEEVPAWLDKVDAAGLRQEFTTPQAMLAVLKATPAALDTLSLNLSDRQWNERPEPKEWSLTEILCHLRDGDREVNLPRVEKILSEENPFVPGINTDTWAEERNYEQEDGRAALREFIAVRSQFVARLESLTEADWRRPARHAIFGPTQLNELVSFNVTHDRTHMQQCLATVAALL